MKFNNINSVCDAPKLMLLKYADLLELDSPGFEKSEKIKGGDQIPIILQYDGCTVMKDICICKIED